MSATPAQSMVKPEPGLSAGPLAPASRPLRGRVAAAKRAQNGPAAPPNSWPRGHPPALRGWSNAQARLQQPHGAVRAPLQSVRCVPRGRLLQVPTDRADADLTTRRQCLQCGIFSR